VREKVLKGVPGENRIILLQLRTELSSRSHFLLVPTAAVSAVVDHLHPTITIIMVAAVIMMVHHHHHIVDLRQVTNTGCLHHHHHHHQIVDLRQVTNTGCLHLLINICLIRHSNSINIDHRQEEDRRMEDPEIIIYSNKNSMVINEKTSVHLHRQHQ
jgi:hypothetical protein